jgi:hypothetical protein
MTRRRSVFLEFVDRKTREAERAVIPRLRTLRDCSAGRPLRAIGTTWSRQHLTTTSRTGGEPHTPWSAGQRPPALDVIVKKESPGPMPVVFEHLAIARPRTSTPAASYQPA